MESAQNAMGSSDSTTPRGSVGEPLTASTARQVAVPERMVSAMAILSMKVMSSSERP